MKNYKKIKSDLTKIINNIDPWDLIGAGAPEDEYDGMINQTISLYNNKELNTENLKQVWHAPELNEEAVSEIMKKVTGYFLNEELNTMENKNLVMQIDNENGIKIIQLSGGDTKKSMSVSSDGSKFLDELGADVILHFDEKNKLISIELMGL